MKLRNWLRNTVLILSVSVLYFCSANPLEPNSESDVTLTKGIPADELTWVSWNPQVTAELAQAESGALGKKHNQKGFQAKNIHNHDGGTVGGTKTYGNTVDIPEYAFDEHILRISVRVLSFDTSGQTAAGVEFLPSRNYDADLFITLNWDFLEVQNDEWDNLNLQPMYSEDGGDTWSPVESYTVDTEARTITFEIDHFTQYGWALDEDD